MKKEEMTTLDFLTEAVGIVAAVICLGLQIYYGMIYDVRLYDVVMNAASLVLIYAGLTLLAYYPEKVNGLTKAVCSGMIRTYTVRMVRYVKVIFTGSLLFTGICDVMGKEINGGYSLAAVALIVITAVYYEVKIIKILRGQGGNGTGNHP